jgi:O-antigen ligase
VTDSFPSSRAIGPTLGSPVVGFVILGSAAVWWLLSGAVAGTSAVDPVALILLVAAILGVCWVAASRRPEVVLAAVLVAATLVFAANAGATLRSGPTQGPFGYANATAAFFAQACIAALMLVVVGRGAVRTVAAVAALASVPVIFLTRSWSVLILLPLLVGIAVVQERRKGSRSAVVLCAGLFLAAFAATIVLGATGGGRDGGPLGDVIDRTLTDERVTLWNEALVVTVRHPAFGVGPGGFMGASATASSDPDLRWAHHEFLQAGAETGLVGGALTVGAFVWGFVALGQGSRGLLAPLGAAALATLGIQACVDYVLHFPLVVLIATAVLGSALGGSRGVRRPSDLFLVSAPGGGSA